MEICVKKIFSVAFFVFITTKTFIAVAADDDLNPLAGDAKLACEAILCLSTEQRPGECTPALNRYFGINFKKPSDTARARRNFLDQCPLVPTAEKTDDK